MRWVLFVVLFSAFALSLDYPGCLEEQINGDTEFNVTYEVELSRVVMDYWKRIGHIECAQKVEVLDCHSGNCYLVRNDDIVKQYYNTSMQEAEGQFAIFAQNELILLDRRKDFTYNVEDGFRCYYPKYREIDEVTEFRFFNTSGIYNSSRNFSFYNHYINQSDFFNDDFLQKEYSDLYIDYKNYVFSDYSYLVAYGNELDQVDANRIAHEFSLARIRQEIMKQNCHFSLFDRVKSWLYDFMRRLLFNGRY